MKRVIRFSKAFLPCAVVSALLILFGVIGYFARGVNLGLDFRPGLIEEVRIADPVLDIQYNGSATINLEPSPSGVSLITTGTASDNSTKMFAYSDYPTVKDLAAVLSDQDGITTELLGDGAVESFWLFCNSDVSTVLSTKPLYLYAKDNDTTIDEVRDSLKEINGIALKELGDANTRGFQLRMAAESESDTNSALKEMATSALRKSFGDNSVVITKADFIGAAFSKTLAQKSALLLLCTVVLIWAYAAFRFHWDFALGSVIALLHDTLIMFTFIIWTQMEFTTTVLAAILTIVGYSINATVVILDRVRFNLSLTLSNENNKGIKFNTILDSALSDTLHRSIITTVTTLFAVLSLYIFTTGSIKDFACALIVGLISGCYSSIFISSGFIDLLRRNWKPEFGIHHSEKSIRRGELDMTGVTV